MWGLCGGGEPTGNMSQLDDDLSLLSEGDDDREDDDDEDDKSDVNWSMGMLMNLKVYNPNTAREKLALNWLDFH